MKKEETCFGRTELEDRHNSGKSQEEKSNAARSYSGERAQAMGSQG